MTASRTEFIPNLPLQEPCADLSLAIGGADCCSRCDKQTHCLGDGVAQISRLCRPGYQWVCRNAPRRCSWKDAAWSHNGQGPGTGTGAASLACISYLELIMQACPATVCAMYLGPLCFSRRCCYAAQRSVCMCSKECGGLGEE